MSKRLGLALILSAALCLVLAFRVYVQFDARRFKLVQAPIAATAGRVLVPSDSSIAVDRLKPPFAVIARINSHAATAQPFTILIDGRAVCTPTIRPGAARRVDCAWSGKWDGTSHQIAVTGPSASWTLDYLELATHDGATRAYDLVIIPAVSSGYVPLRTGWILFAWIAIAILLLLPAPEVMPRAVAVLYKAGATVVVVLLALVLLSRLVSPYAVILSWPAFIKALAVLLAPRLWFAGSWLAGWRREALRQPVVVGLLVAILVLVAYGRMVQREARDLYHGNYSGFLHLSARRFDGDPMLAKRSDIRRTLLLDQAGGYDAQFMYLETFDPFLRQYQSHPSTYRRFIDNPPYRYGRIGFSLLTGLIAGHRWPLYPRAMMALIMAALCLSGLALAWIARSAGASPWWGALILIVPGFWQSVQFGLPEPIAAAALLGGYLCWRRRQWTGAGLLLACSLLVRETGVIFVVLLAAGTLWSGRRRDAVRMVLIAVLPVLVWRLYVGWILWPDWGVRGVWLRTNDFAWPLAGIRHLWTLIAHGQYYPGISSMSRAGIWFPVVLASGAALAMAFAIVAPSATSLAAVCYGGMALSFDYAKVWLQVGNTQRVTFELFLVLALLSVGAGTCPRALRRSVMLFWIGTAIYVFFGGPNADYIRQTVLWKGF